MSVTVCFYSYFKELTGVEQMKETLPADATLEQLYGRLAERFPKLAAMKKCTLMAVGVEYKKSDHILHEGDEVSLFPPVQGG